MNSDSDELNPSENRNSKQMEAGIRALADNLDVGLAVVQKGQIVFINDKLSEVTRLPRENIENKFLLELFAVDFEQSQYFDIRDRMERGEDIEYPVEIRFRIITGRIIEMRNRSSVIEWGGQPATIHFLEDITKKKETERLLIQQTEINTILTDTVSRILASPLSLDETAGTVLDSAMGLTESKSGVLAINDGDSTRVLQNRCTEGCESCNLFLLMDSILNDSKRLDRSRPGRHNGSFYLNEELDNSTKCNDGSIIRNILRVPVESTDGLSGQIILAGAPDSYGPWDLDAMEKVVEVLNLALVRNRAVEELQTAKETAEREASSRSQFLANVTHEVRSPLNGVLMMASLLQDTKLDADQNELLGVVTFSARTLDRLIRDLTDINQIRAGKFKVFNAYFDLAELCRNVLETHRPEALRKGLLLDHSIAAEAARFYGDRERIGQILANIMVNAIKYTFNGGVKLDVGYDDKELRIEVTDTGKGISKEDRKDIFGMFRQVESDNPDTPIEGSGIGLAVVKELSDAMNGRIVLESAPGEGSRFTVFLPDISPGETITSRVASNRPAGDSVPGSRILIAEDEGLNRLYLRTLLEREGCEVEEAFDGQEAVDLAANNKYDLILMDINMPRMDGLEASAAIRHSGNTVPIVAITAHTYGEDRFHITRAGLDDILRKPFNEDVLVDCLNRYVRN